MVEERDEAAGPRQRHPAKQAEDTPFGLFVAENVQLVRVLSEALAKPHQAGEAYRRRAKVVALATS